MQESDTLYELAQEGQHLAPPATSRSGGTAARWGADAISSCIYETLPGPHCTPQLRTDPAAYHALRTRWPLRAGVWHLLFRSRMAQLVAALLGSQAVLYNDQVTTDWRVGRGGGKAGGQAGGQPGKMEPACHPSQLYPTWVNN